MIIRSFQQPSLLVAGILMVLLIIPPALAQQGGEKPAAQTHSDQTNHQTRFATRSHSGDSYA